MSRKSWHLERRTFLKGLGVTAALPWLEAMTPRSRGGALGAGTQLARDAVGDAGRLPPRRLCYVYFPNGASLPAEDDGRYAQWRWFPSGSGQQYRFSDVLRCLEPHRQRLSVVGGLSHPLSRELLGHLAGDTWLTAGDLRGDQYQNRVSADQVAARHLGRHTRYPSLVLSTDGGVGYKSRVSTLSFDANGKPVPSEHRQRQIFERYFAPDGAATTEARRRSLLQDRRIVDLVLEDSKALQRRLGRRDQQKLDEYMASLAAVEAQVRRNEAWLDVPRRPFDAAHLDLDAAADVDPAGYLRGMYELMVLALQTDLTRVMTYMTGREDGMGFADQFPNRALGINRGHHTISHDQHEGHWEQWGRYDQWHAEQFAWFLSRLAQVEDEHGPLLDSTMVLYGSCCSTTHNARNYPLVLAGGSALGVRHGSYLRFDEKTPFSNLLLSMLHQAGVEVESFADSTGTLPELFG